MMHSQSATNDETSHISRQRKQRCHRKPFKDVLTGLNVSQFKSLTIAKSVTSVRDGAFEGFSGLTNLAFELSENASDTLTIGSQSFASSCSLVNVTIGRPKVIMKGDSFNLKCMTPIKNLIFKRHSVREWGCTRQRQSTILRTDSMQQRGKQLRLRKERDRFESGRDVAIF